MLQTNGGLFGVYKEKSGTEEGLLNGCEAGLIGGRYATMGSTFCPKWEVSDNVGLGEG